MTIPRIRQKYSPGLFQLLPLGLCEVILFCQAILAFFHSFLCEMEIQIQCVFPAIRKQKQSFNGVDIGQRGKVVGILAT